MFVYADRLLKLRRSEDRADENEQFSEKEIYRRRKQIDKERAAYRKLFTDEKWDREEFYCIYESVSGISGIASYVVTAFWMVRNL